MVVVALRVLQAQQAQQMGPEHGIRPGLASQQPHPADPMANHKGCGAGVSQSRLGTAFTEQEERAQAQQGNGFLPACGRAPPGRTEG
jgi:hypothetical protein